MDTGRFLKVPGQTDTEMDKYTASIELSNACRQFYQARLEAAHGYKSKWESRHVQSTCCAAENSNNNNNNNNGNSSSSSKCKAPDNHNCRAASSSPHQRRQRNSIDEAMDRLRTEMTSLMDQDLSLMKQLLTLNETIEELKWQRRYYYSRGSVRGDSSSSRLSLRDSDGSISDTDMYSEVEDHGAHVPHAPPAAATTAPLPSVAGPLLSGQTPPPPPPPVVIFTSPSASCSNASHLARKQGALVYGCGHVTVERAPSAGGSEKSRGGDSRATEACAGVKVFHHSEQDSFDSGFHEPSSEEEAALVS